jgi:mannose-1-phosphate guanylyltransferase
VLAGGAGTRFWPASRRARPKPFVPLLGERTLLEDTLDRLRPLAPPRRTWVVAARALAPLVRRALRKRGGVRLLLEPDARDTAPAVAWSAARIAAEKDGGVMGVFPADHHIPAPAAFRRTARLAAGAAADGESIVLLGIRPTRPESGYGWLRVGPERGAAPVRSFLEKPPASRARRLLAAGDWLWNAGMLFAAPERLLEETCRCAPELWRPLGRVLRDASRGRAVGRARLTRAWRGVRPVPFDRAVLERSRRVRAVRGRFRWSDVGSWDALCEHLPRDRGNRFRGDPPLAAIDAGENLVWNTSGRPVALLGVSGLVVVETDDALLVCARERAQEVRRVVRELGRRGREELT